MDVKVMDTVQVDTMMHKKLLIEILNELSSIEFEKFKSLIKLRRSLIRSRLSVAHTHDIVELMVKNYRWDCVKVTKKALKKMNRTDLVQRLSVREKHWEQHPTLIKRVETMTSVIELLLETLAGLSNRELKDFKKVLLSRIHLRKPYLEMLMMTDMQDTVFIMVQTFGQPSVKETKDILIQMNRRDLVQRLSDSSSGPKKKHSVDEHLSALIHKVATKTAVRELLLETLNDLSDWELNTFRWFLQFTHFKKGLPCIAFSRLEPTGKAAILVDLIMETYGQQSVEVIREVFMEMKRTDLVQRLSETSSGHKATGSSFEAFGVKATEGEKHSVDEQWPALIHKVETMTSVIELLLETLAGLSNRELQDFKQVLRHHLRFTRWRFNITWMLLDGTDLQDTVFFMVQAYGQQSMGGTKHVLEDINRPDLVQRLSDHGSGSKKKHYVDEQPSTLIQKVATMAAVKEMLLETLNDLSYQEFEKFKEVLKWTVSQKCLPDILLTLSETADSAEIVDLMLQTYGQQSVDLTKKIFNKMNRSDLVQKLSNTSSGHKEEHRPAQKVESGVKQILLEIINDLSHQDLMKFKWSLQLTHFEKGLQQISLIQLEGADQGETVNLMVQTCGQQFVQVTMEVFMDMNRTDLAERLSHSSRELREEQRSSLPQKDKTITVKEKLLETLGELSLSETEHFKWWLQHLQKKDLPRIPRSRVERAYSFELVDLMVEIYGQQSVEVTREVLKKMNRMDLVQSLSDTSSGSKGPSGSLEFEAHGRMMESSDWTKLEPEVNSTDADEAPTYSLQSEEGKFECRVSGLRWVCEEKVSFKYQFWSWEEHMERMESLQYMPAGPLLDITVIAGKLNEVYLPHWICTDENPKIFNKFAVLHIDACGDVVEKVSKVTSSHVKLSELIFSPRAVLMKVGFPVKINCNVLIYKTNTAFLTLHVYLIPRDPGLGQTMDKRELSYGYKVIRKPHPEMSLKMHNRFTLTTDLDSAEIYPEKLKLRYESTNPNFFEVFVENPDRNFQLKLAQENELQPVWTCAIRKDEYQSTGYIQEEHTVDELSALVQKAATITTVGEKLLKMLQSLREEDFEDFKWFLQKRNLIPADLPCIPWSKLEKADRKHVVDLIEQTYSQRAVEVTKMLFKKINRNDLVKLL
ncbi:uncharacterized protein [Thunnus thynnus]|uniref:uncharacterized protein isoform X2 n=1 Tax=Thunnus thynnus TaxID=8237 RepID=UPI0035273E7E